MRLLQIENTYFSLVIITVRGMSTYVRQRNEGGNSRNSDVQSRHVQYVQQADEGGPETVVTCSSRFRSTRT